MNMVDIPVEVYLNLHKFGFGGDFFETLREEFGLEVMGAGNDGIRCCVIDEQKYLFFKLRWL